MHFHPSFILCVFLSFSHAKVPYERDMRLNKEQLSVLRGAHSRNVMPWSKYYWPESTVVYIFGDGLTKSAKRIIQKAMQKISNKTCILFRETSNKEEDHVVIERIQDNCWSTIGYNEGSKMRVNLGRSCMLQGVIQHELLHVLGFLHMHCAPNRDKYIKIVYENIKEEEKYNFKKYETQHFNMTYDYKSVMHYGPFLFSRNGKETIVPLKKNVKIGQARRLSVKDVKKVKAIYCDTQ